MQSGHGLPVAAPISSDRVVVGDAADAAADLDRLALVLRRVAAGGDDHRLLDHLSAVAPLDYVGADDPRGDDAIGAVGRPDWQALPAVVV
jgi:hypothetical protein